MKVMLVLLGAILSLNVMASETLMMGRFEFKQKNDCKFKNFRPKGRYINIPIDGLGTSVRPGDIFNVVVYKEGREAYLKISSYGGTWEWPLFMTKSRTKEAYYQKGKFQYNKNSVSFKSNGKKFGWCYVDYANSNTKYPCYKSWDEAWQLKINKNGNLVSKWVDHKKQSASACVFKKLK